LSFDNCTQAYNAGYANLPQGSPHYAKKLDRDGDGVACDNPPPGFTPNTPGATTSSTAAPTGEGGRLPTTGPGEAAAAGALLLVAGAAAVVVTRLRRRRFQA
jgi:hypothetical protein